MWGAIIAGVAMLITSLLTNSANNKKARENAAQQVQDQKELTKFNQQVGMQNWENTNFAAQREQMQKAGLNIGMMYSGNGGQSMGMTPAGSTSKADTIPLDLNGGMGMGLQAALAKANIDNIKADTENKKIDAEQKTGVDLENKTATLEGAKLGNVGKEFDNKMKEIQANVNNETQSDLIYKIKAEGQKALDEARSQNVKANVDEATEQEQIKQIKQRTTEQQLSIAAQKAGLIKTNADTKAVNQSIVNMATQVNMMQQNNMREWDKMSQTDKEIAVKQIMAKNASAQTEFNTSTAAQLKQWTSIIGDIIQAMK